MNKCLIVDASKQNLMFMRLWSKWFYESIKKLFSAITILEKKNSVYFQILKKFIIT